MRMRTINEERGLRTQTHDPFLMHGLDGPIAAADTSLSAVPMPQFCAGGSEDCCSVYSLSDQELLRILLILYCARRLVLVLHLVFIYFCSTMHWS